MQPLIARPRANLPARHGGWFTSRSGNASVSSSTASTSPDLTRVMSWIVSVTYHHRRKTSRQHQQTHRHGAVLPTLHLAIDPTTERQLLSDTVSQRPRGSQQHPIGPFATARTIRCSHTIKQRHHVSMSMRRERQTDKIENLPAQITSILERSALPCLQSQVQKDTSHARDLRSRWTRHGDGRRIR